MRHPWNWVSVRDADKTRGIQWTHCSLLHRLSLRTRWLLLSLLHVPWMQQVGSSLTPSLPHLSHLRRKAGKHPAPGSEAELGGSETKGEESSSFLQWCYYQEACRRKLLLPPSHYVYLVRSWYEEPFRDSATGAAFSMHAATAGGPWHRLMMLHRGSITYCWLVGFLCQQRIAVCATGIY